MEVVLVVDKIYLELRVGNGCDLDNQGLLFIANGYRKDVTDLDFIFFGTEPGNPFGTSDARRKKINKEFL